MRVKDAEIPSIFILSMFVFMMLIRFLMRCFPPVAMVVRHGGFSDSMVCLHDHHIRV